MKHCLALPLLVLSGGAPLRAQDAASTSAPADPMPLREVVLFSSGVGYFGRAGEIRGASTVPLLFRAAQVNDVLKSLVIFDAGGGVRPVTFATKDSAARQLSQNGVAIDSAASIGAILRRFQGSQVRVETPSGRVEGRILSVQIKTITDAANRAQQVEYLNVVTTGGLRSLPLESVGEIALLDERLNRQLQESLLILGAQTDDSRRTVELHFDGNSRRTVRAGYLLEAPVWKTSYRLVLDSTNKEQPYLQGWGLVENTTDDDWRGVRLSLVSGRPISFVQDLYQPLYIPRPVVAPQLDGSPTPQLYGQAVEAPAAQVFDVAPAARRPNAPAAPSGGFGGGAFDNSEAARRLGALEARPVTEETEAERRDIAQSLAKTAAQAQGAERGELFEYAIQGSVAIPENQAAMVPIVGANIEGTRVSIFDPASSNLVLSGFRMRNSTKLNLAGGPLSVFQDGVYAGDAQIGNVGPGDERLVSFAVDGDIAPAVREAPNRAQTLSLSAKAGVLTITRQLSRTVTYTFRNTGPRAKKVLVLQPIEAGYELSKPAGKVEKTSAEYRLPVDVAPNQSVDLVVETQRPLSETVALLNLDLDVLISYAREGKASPALKAALQSLVAKRRAIQALETQRANLDRELAAIDAEQKRIRENMAQLDRNSPLYLQYVRKLSEQEGRIEKLRADAAALQTRDAAARRELEAQVDALSVE